MEEVQTCLPKFTNQKSEQYLMNNSDFRMQLIHKKLSQMDETTDLHENLDEEGSQERGIDKHINSDLLMHFNKT